MTMNSNKNVFTYFLKRLGVKFTASYAEKLFNEHPNKYNLLGLSDLLSFYNITNNAYKLENKEDLILIKTPYIAHIGGDFAAVISIDNQKVVYNSDNKTITLPINKFIDTCSGIVLLAELSPDSKEPNFRENFKKEMIAKLFNASIFMSFILLFALLIIHSEVYNSLFLSISLFINLVGLFVSFLLLLSHLNIKSEIRDRICSIFKHSDCNNILESNAASFLHISWSEYGFSYFLGNLFLILIFPEYASWMFLINIMALPYSFWSIWFQGLKAKQWCPLCLSVQIILWGIFLTNLIFNLISIPQINLFDFTIVTLSYGMPLIILHKLIELLPNVRLATRKTQELNSFKANDKIFITLLNEQPYYEISSEVSKVTFGNPQSKIRLTVLTNPHCNPCARMHKRIEELLKKNNNILVQYIFSSFSSELEVSARFLIAVYLQYSPLDRYTIFEKWFEKGKYDKETFFVKYPVNLNDNSVKEEFQRHKTWVERTKLSYTPFLLVNGYEFPDSYLVEDLVYFSDLEF